jgi:hypothetical protein
MELSDRSHLQGAVFRSVTKATICVTMTDVNVFLLVCSQLKRASVFFSVGPAFVVSSSSVFGNSAIRTCR